MTHPNNGAIERSRNSRQGTTELMLATTVQGVNSKAVEVLTPFEGRFQDASFHSPKRDCCAPEDGPKTPGNDAEKLPTTDTLHRDTQPSTQEDTTGQTGHTAQTGAQRTDRA